MKLIEVLNAKEPLKRLTDLRFTSFGVVRKLVGLTKEIDEEIKFYVDEEKKLVERYASKDDKGNPEVYPDGKIKLNSIEDKIEFEKEIFNLRSTDVDSIHKVEIKESDFKDKDNIPSPSDIIALSGFIEFVEE